MIYHMTTRTTILLDKRHLKELKAIAAAEGRTLTSVIAECIRDGLARFRARREPKPGKPTLTSHNLGRLPFNVASRQEMYEYFDREHHGDLR